MTPPWITEGEKVLGLHEARDGSKLSAWLRSDGKTLGNPSKMPWCGDFVDTALARALPKEPRPGALGVNPYWALNWGLLGQPTPPAVGAIATFKRSGGGHVGFLVGVSEDGLYYLVLGGNQSNRVSRTWIAVNRAQALRWPATATAPKKALPVVKKKTAASTNEA